MPRPKMITLQTIPVDCLQHVGTYLRFPYNSTINDIDELTLAATLNDYELLERCMKRHHRSHVSPKVAQSGNFRILKWVIQKGCPWNERTCEAAARSGNLEMLQWLPHRRGSSWNQETCKAAAESGNLEMLKWLHSKGCRWDKRTFVAAAESANLEMLQWLHSAGCPWNSRTCKAAARSGNLEMLKWLHSAGCPWGEKTCWAAAKSGHLEILQWLHSAGCPWNSRTCKAAARSGNLVMLQWAIDHGCPEPNHDRDYVISENTMYDSTQQEICKNNSTTNTTTVGEASAGELDANGQVMIVESPVARQNRFILQAMMNKLRLLIGTTGQTQENPKLNEERRRCCLYYRPVSKR